MLKSSVILFRSVFGLITFRFACGRTQKPSFLWFRDLGRVPEPPNQLCLFLETPGYLKQSKNNPTSCFGKYVYKFQMCENPEVGIRRTIPTIRPINSWTSWIWAQYLSKITKGKFGNMGSLNLRYWFFWNQETKNLWNVETKKQKTKKPRNQDAFLFSGIPSTSAPDHILLHTCSRSSVHVLLSLFTRR